MNAIHSARYSEALRGAAQMRRATVRLKWLPFVDWPRAHLDERIHGCPSINEYSHIRDQWCKSCTGNPDEGHKWSCPDYEPMMDSPFPGIR